MSRSFAVTYDYLCPFARNAHEAIVAGLREGKDWDVRFLAFSLHQVHVPEGEPPVWERPPDERGRGVRAHEWGLAVRDTWPEKFHDFHLALFAIRFDRGEKHEPDVLRKTAIEVGLDAAAVEAEVASGRPLETLRREHTEALEQWAVFGVPTFIENGEAVFVRLMERGRVDDVERVLDQLSWARLNEFKRTRIPA